MNEKEVSKKNKLERIQIPIRSVNSDYEYDFNIQNYKLEGLISLFTILIIPLISSIILTFIFNMNGTSNWTNVTQMGITVICAAIGFFIIYQRSNKHFWSDGLANVYLFVFVPVGFTLGGTIVVASLIGNGDKEKLNVVSQFTTIICQGISEVIIITFALIKNKVLLARIKKTFCDNWKMIILVCSIAFLVLFLLSTIIFNYGWNQLFPDKENSQNQSQLVELIHSKNTTIKIAYIFVLFIFSVIIAPLCEEISCRDSVYTNSGNMWLGLCYSSIFFGFLHFGSTGDFINSPSYLSAGFVLSFLFIICRGNMTYTWITHMLYNLVAFVLTIIS